MIFPPSSTDTSTLPRSSGKPQDERGPTPYLLIFEAQGAAIHPLPHSGAVTIGRSAEALVRLQDASASRIHARLLLTQDECVLSDEGSQNGTSVNGDRLTAPRRLISGDSITIGDTTLVFQRHPARQASLVVDLIRFRERLAAEIDRCARYQRRLALLCVRFGDKTRGRDAIAVTLERHLREMDLAAWDDSAGLLLLAPEMSDEEADGLGGDLLLALAPLGPAQIGIARWPGDGHDVDTLVAGARAAAAAAAPGQRLRAAQTVTTLDIGGAIVVLADPAMVHSYERLRRCAPTGLSILIYGESGTGKEVAARAVHGWSPRAGGPFVTLNCAAVPEALANTEILGAQRGTQGGEEDRPGLLEAAHGGTLFLDEVGALPAALQALLVRVLDNRRVQRLGGTEEHPVDLRVIATSRRNLKDEVQAGRFRQDLYYCLRGLEIVLPPLRDRRRELPVLAQALLDNACARAGRPPIIISPAAMHQLLGHPFPGNIRELQRAMDCVAAIADEPMLLPWHLTEALAPAGQAPPAPPPAAAPRRFRPLDEEVRELECTRITEALVAAGFVQVRAAELLSVPDKTFRIKVKQYRIPTRLTEQRE